MTMPTEQVVYAFHRIEDFFKRPSWSITDAQLKEQLLGPDWKLYYTSARRFPSHSQSPYSGARWVPPHAQSDVTEAILCVLRHREAEQTHFSKDEIESFVASKRQELIEIDAELDYRRQRIALLETRLEKYNGGPATPDVETIRASFATNQENLRQREARKIFLTAVLKQAEAMLGR
jgi:hypothetical protein